MKSRLSLPGIVHRRRDMVIGGTSTLFALAAGTWTATRAGSAHAHHGWSSFDESQPLYIEGRVKRVKWQNPHAEIAITVPADATLPADLAKRSVPAQTSNVDGAKILAGVRLPNTRGDWTIELSPMSRIESWKVPQPKTGDTVAAVAYGFKDEKDAFARVEYLIIGERMFGLRSNPG